MGMTELLVLLPTGLISIGLPVVALIVLVMIYRKVSRIEQLLREQDRAHEQ